MFETSRRVNVTLTIPTDAGTTDVLNAVLAAVQRGPVVDNNLMPVDVESTHVHAFDLGEDDKPETLVQLVITPADVLLGVYTDDPELADEHARTVDGVVVELPVVADYRAEAAG